MLRSLPRNPDLFPFTPLDLPNGSLRYKGLPKFAGLLFFWKPEPQFLMCAILIGLGN